MKRVDEEPTPKAIEDALTQDPLHRKREIEDFLKMLIAVEPPYTFVIDAPWGSGKSFFVKQVARALQMTNPALSQDSAKPSTTFGNIDEELHKKPYLPIYFNAWEDDHFDNPILPVLASIASTTGEKSVKGGEDFRKGIIGAIEAAASLVGYGGDINGVIENFSGTDFLEQYKNERELRGKIDELIKSNLPKIADRAVIFIDELDRCRPEFAIKVLEQTKTLFQQENIVVVYSTDITQLAHSLQGIYGPRFDGRKYLERFYDKRLELNPIKPADYLLYKGINTMDGYTFMDITIDLLGYKQASLRACNRLIDSITNLSRYIANHWEHFGNGRVQHFPDQGLLPVINILAYYDPLAWHEMKTSTDFGAVYELAKHSNRFIRYLDEVIESVWGANMDELPYKRDIENRRRRFVEDLCALIYGNNDMDPRVKELGNSELTRMSFNQQLYQRLAPPL
ncbi:P-loop NTPase fold protein [Collinsella sp. BG-O-102]|uniref:KAP family P-loop NTPase fold protein n=1 Tax=Collinsella sp. BG-O-102 TaxID=2949659 RepID=UPI00202F4E6A|nr:P-loop NTPase fold protein [Collinsella sp. BG-O-102]MCM0711011.1 KAP family NTPase [Collinsella sp. BG-O-102]